MGLFDLVKGYGTGQIIWAVTNVCNAGCQFCSYTTGKGGDPVYVDREKAEQVLDILEQRNWKIISFTGGEPLLNPDIYHIITSAVKRGFITRTGSNGRLLSAEVIKKLKKTGIRNFWISIDSEDEERHNANRGITDLLAHVKKMIPLLKEEGVRVNASVPINKLVGDYPRLLDSLVEMGLDTVAFCYPMTVMEASYGGAAASHLVEYTPGELAVVLKTIMQLKAQKYRKTRIVNPRAGLADIIGMQQGKPGRYPCLGGYKYFYLDWNLTLYRCAFLSENYGNILELHPGQSFAPSSCDRCVWQCFRDPSVCYFVLESFRKAGEEIRKGSWQKAAAALGDRRNKESLAAWAGMAADRFYA